MRIKLLLVLVIPIVWFSSCKTNRDKFTVIGDINGMPASQIVILEEMGLNDISIIDSARSNDKGHFELSGSAPEQGLYRLRFPNNHILLVIDKGNIKVTANWANLEGYSVAGSEGSAVLKNFMNTVRERLRDIYTMSVVLDSVKVKGNDSLLTVAKTDMQDMSLQFTRYIEQFADTTKHLPAALFAAQMLNASIEKDFLTAFTQGLERRFPNARLAKDFNTKYNQIVASQNQPQHSAGPALGAVAPDLSLPTPDGKTVTLSSFKGKYVLLDFWASWCGPCRQENPNVVAAFNKYQSKNFTVFSVSLDDNKDKWLGAIEKDNLSWTHVSDLKGWESIAARTYGIEAIPSNYLLDPEGKIIAQDLRGEELEKTLAGLLK